LSQAAAGGVLFVPPLKLLVKARLGKSIGLSTLYLVLSRHGWRKLTPDKNHPKADPAAQDKLKKTPRASGNGNSCVCRTSPLSLMFLDKIAARYQHENVVMVIDGAGWH